RKQIKRPHGESPRAVSRSNAEVQQSERKNGDLKVQRKTRAKARKSQVLITGRIPVKIGSRSIRYSEGLTAAGIEPSVESVGVSYDNALAETIDGFYKAEVIHRPGHYRNFEAVAFARLEWIDWYMNRRRRPEPIGTLPQTEAEERDYAMLDQAAMAAKVKPNGLRETRCGSPSVACGNDVYL
ncbi:hypothetical protein WNZ15_11945, partial [Roseibium sp. AS2]